MDNFSPKEFSAVRFIGLMQTVFGSKPIAYNDYSVNVDFDNAVLSDDQTKIRVAVNIYTPYLGDKIAKLFETNMVRIGCKTHVNFQLLNAEMKPTFSILNDELYSLFDEGNPYFFEVDKGMTTTVIPIADIDQLNSDELPMIYEALRAVYFNEACIKMAMHNYKGLVQIFETNRKMQHLILTMKQVQNATGQFDYVALIYNKQGHPALVHETEAFKANNLANAVSVAELIYSDKIVVGVHRVNY